MKTLYNLTREDAKTLFNHCENNVNKLALLLYNTGKAKTLESGIEKAKRIKNFAIKN